MANELANKIDEQSGKKKIPCDDGCKYFMFPQNEIACCLSEVYSVKKGEGCYTYEAVE